MPSKLVFPHFLNIPCAFSSGSLVKERFLMRQLGQHESVPLRPLSLMQNPTAWECPALASRTSKNILTNWNGFRKQLQEGGQERRDKTISLSDQKYQSTNTYLEKRRVFVFFYFILFWWSDLQFMEAYELASYIDRYTANICMCACVHIHI